jgi:hypothetical protein
MDRRRIMLKALYWLAVLVVSLAVLVGLILLLEARDSSSLNGGAWIAAITSARPA